ncbi:sugar phosphate isomerase/epimerase family protein [Fusicatenibacter sp.]
METERKILKDCPISCFADEISTSLDRQIAVLHDLGISHIELRSTDNVNVADYSMDYAKEVRRKLADAGIRVSAIGSPIGKIGIEDDFNEHLKKLQHVETLADLFETKYIRMFSFYMPENSDPSAYRDPVFFRMEQMVNEAAHSGITLLHENEKGIYGDNAPRCLELMKQFYGDAFRCTFDFANFVQCRQDTLAAYEMLKPYITYVHIKDAKTADGTVVPAGTGDGNVNRILTALDQTGYNGFLSLEPHLANFAGLGSLEKDAAVRVENDTEKAFCVAYRALEKILTGK